MANDNDILLKVGLDFSSFQGDQKLLLAKTEQLLKQIKKMSSQEFKLKFNVETPQSQAIKQLEKLRSDLKQFSAGATVKAAVADDKRAQKAIEDGANRAIALEQKREDAARKASQARVNAEISAEKRIQAEQARTAKAQEAAAAKVNRALDIKARRKPIDDYQTMERAAIGAAFGISEVSYATERFAGQLPRLRYALYDVSNNLAIAGTAALGLSVATFGIAAKFDREFANVERTTGASGDALRKLREDFINLNQEIPASWTELTSIGTLAGQLNIAADNVADFTKTVAMFSATTDVSAEAAATALGRLDQLLSGGGGDDTERFNKLGSAILAVGVNSVATESQIIAVAQNIASIGNLAGLSRDQLIGFSGALASVGIAPELARGLTTRLFTDISSAISQGSVQLETFGRISGMTADEFKASWSGDAAGTLVELLKGLNEEGGNAEAALAQLGITSVRDVPNILKLAQGYEEVARLLGVSAEGYNEATALQEQYGTIASQITEKIKVLVQNFQQLVAASGGAVDMFGGLIDILTKTLDGITDFIRTPFGQWFSGVATIGTGVVGVLLLLGAGIVRLISGFLAWKTSTIEALVAQGALAKGTKVTEINIRSLTSALFAATGGAKAFNTALKGTLIGVAFAVGAGLVAEAMDKITYSLKSAEDKAKDAFGGFDELTSALKKDTQIMNDSISANLSSADSWDTVTSSVNDATYAIGENTTALLANKAASDPTVQGLIETADKLNKAFSNINGPQFDVQGFIKASAQNDAQAALQIIEQYSTQAEAFLRQRQAAGQEWVQSQQDVIYLTGYATQSIDFFAEALQAAATQGTITTAVAEAMGVSIDSTGDSVTNFNEKLSEIQQAVDDAFGQSNVLMQFGDDIRTLAQGIIENGTAFDYLSQSGSTNMQNLQGAIGSTIAAAQVLGVDATEAVAALFIGLQQQGIDTATLLAQLANVQLPGVNNAVVAQYLKGGKQLSAGAQSITNAFNGVAAGAKKAGSAVGGVTKQVRTLTDYANDLSTVFSRAFEIRFSGSQAFDNITKTFTSIAKATAEAREEIADLNADIDSLNADRALQQYFLSVAEAYGDTLQAQKIRANLAKIDADLTAKTKLLSKAQDKTNKTLVGNSDAAIDNRAEILGLVGDYQNYIKSLAASGMSQDELRAKSIQLKQDFIAQATQLGYNINELGTYAAAFDDVAIAIDNIPRNITVTANTNPALQALNEFKAKADAATASRNVNVGASVDYSSLAKLSRANAIIAKIAEVDSIIANTPRNYTSRISSLKWNIEYLRDQLNSGNFASGGYTGAGGKYEVAGIVHRGEYVVPKEQVNQTTGLPYYMQQPRSFAQGGYAGGTQYGGSSMMVELSPYDRKLLAAAGNVQLRLDGKVVAQNTNANNIMAAQRGSN